MEILKITGEHTNGPNKVVSKIIANPDTKSIDILGYKFDIKSLALLSEWIQQYKLQNSHDITLNFLAYEVSIGNQFFNMKSFPISVSNESWKSLINYDLSQNDLGQVLSLLQTFNFNIEGTDSSFNIQGFLNKGIVKITGGYVDYEPVIEFSPLIAWIEKYISCGKKQIIIHFKPEYFNTSMYKVIKDFFSFLKESELEFEITWFYPDDDQDMEAAGKEYRSMMGFSDKTMCLVSYELE